MSKLMHYQVFIAIVELGSIAKAALHLHVTPAAVSKQLSNFEQSLGLTLFNRSHKRLELTSAGESFYPKCKKIMLAILDAETQLHQDNLKVQGKLSISLPKVLARGPIVPMIADFVRQHPELELDMTFSDELVDLHQSKIDFAFRLGALADNSHLIALPLLQTQLLPCVTSDYLEQFGSPESFQNLGKHRLILMTPFNASRALKAFFQKQQLKVDKLPVHKSNDIEGVYQAVMANLGIGLLLDFSIQKELNEGHLTSIWPSLTPELPRKTLYLLFKSDQQNSYKQIAFKAHVKAFFENKGNAN